MIKLTNMTEKNFIKGEVSFKKWLKELNRVAPIVAPRAYKDFDPVEGYGADSWKDYFDMWYSPEDALIEDLSYGN